MTASQAHQHHAAAGQQSPHDASALRIALFSGNYNYVMDGPVRALNMLVGHLEERGHEVLVFAPTTDTPAFQHKGELVSVPSVPLPGSRSEYRLGLGLTKHLKRRLDEFAPTIIHLAAPDYLGLSALKYARKNSLPAVASFHTRFDTYPRYYGMGWLEGSVTNYLRYFYNRCERVYAPSQSMVEELRSDRVGKDIRLWARGVDKSQFNPQRRDLDWRRSLGIDDDQVVAAFVGRVVLEKGIDLFAEAFNVAQKKSPGLRALIVGDGPERQHFENLLPNEVFIGFQQGEALARAYASADVFFNPSITETFGNVTLEAMASGLPCICAAASGSKSLVENKHTGLLVSEENAGEQFAAALHQLAGSQDMRRQFGANALARAADFEWAAILDQLLADYCEVVRTFGGSRRAK